jgi:CheY-like chemotaxis protein
MGDETKLNRNVTILVAEDDEGHALLINRNLRRAGIENPIRHFPDGQEILDFLGLGDDTDAPGVEAGQPYLLLLDIRMPKLDGVEVLRQIRADPELRGMPVIMVTTTDDPREIEHCHRLGCSTYVTKPVDYEKFVEAIRRLGLFLMVIEVPRIGENES